MFFPTDSDTPQVELVDGGADNQHRPAGAHGYVGKVDVPGPVEQGAAFLSRCDQKASGAHLLGKPRHDYERSLRRRRASVPTMPSNRGMKPPTSFL